MGLLVIYVTNTLLGWTVAYKVAVPMSFVFAACTFAFLWIYGFFKSKYPILTLMRKAKLPYSLARKPYLYTLSV